MSAEFAATWSLWPMSKRELYELFQKHFPMCCCGERDLCVEFIGDVMMLLEQGHDGTREGIDLFLEEYKELLPLDDDRFGALAWLLLHRLEQARLIEHGGNISASWTTDLGRRAVAAMWLHEDAVELMTGKLNDARESVPDYDTIPPVAVPKGLEVHDTRRCLQSQTSQRPT